MIKILDKPLTEIEFTVFDIETTGLHPKEGDEILEISGIKMTGNKINSTAKLTSLVNPNKPIPFKVTLKNNIDSKMVKDAPPIEEVLPKFLKFIGDSVLVAQNIAFDLSFIRYKIEELELEKLENCNLDTYQMSKFLFPDKKYLNLDALASELNIQPDKGMKRHRSLADALIAAKIFSKFVKMLAKRKVITLRDATQLGLGNF
ncbi:3'-5' exoribonuclease [bacterium]|nr:3'-5' exoribonuclease [bacterium]